MCFRRWMKAAASQGYGFGSRWGRGRRSGSVSVLPARLRCQCCCLPPGARGTEHPPPLAGARRDRYRPSSAAGQGPGEGVKVPCSTSPLLRLMASVQEEGARPGCGVEGPWHPVPAPRAPLGGAFEERRSGAPVHSIFRWKPGNPAGLHMPRGIPRSLLPGSGELSEFVFLTSPFFCRRRRKFLYKNGNAPLLPSY